jgi:hypothetical protein
MHERRFYCISFQAFYNLSSPTLSVEVHSMDNEKILSTWAKAGVEDFYLAFELEDRWHKQSLFSCHQGLEKIC